MNRGYHGAHGSVPYDGIFIEAARTPGHPLNKLARRQGIPPEEICDFLRAERDYYENQGMESPWARIVHETGQAPERNEHFRASGGGGGGYGERGDRRRRQQTDRYNREVADYNRELNGFHREVDQYHREMDQLSHNLDRFATLQQQQQPGRRGQPQPSETTGSEKDPDEAAEVESRQQQVRAERRLQAEMISEQKRMEQMEQMAAMAGMYDMGGMGGGRDPRMGRGGWY